MTAKFSLDSPRNAHLTLCSVAIIVTLGVGCGPRILGGLDEGSPAAASGAAGEGGASDVVTALPVGSTGGASANVAGGGVGGSGSFGGSSAGGAGVGGIGPRGCVNCQWSFVGSEDGLLANINAEHELVVANDIVHIAGLRIHSPHPRSPETWHISLGTFANGVFSLLDHEDVDPLSYPSLALGKNVPYATLGHASVRTPASDSWAELGTLSKSRDDSPAPVATDAKGRPYIAHTEMMFSTVRRWEEPTWVEVGSPRELPVRRTSLAVDGNDNLYAAYVDSGTLGVSLEKLALPQIDQGADWEAVGEPNFRTLLTWRHWTSLAVARDGTPYMAFLSEDGTKIIVMTFDGSEWKELGEPLGAEGIPQGPEHMRVLPSIAVSPTDVPHVTFRGKAKVDDMPAMLVAFWSGEAWVPLDVRGFTKDEVRHVSLAFASNGTAYVSYNRNDANPSLIVRKFD